MNDLKVIATDLDGTLIDRRGRLSERNRRALTTARSMGVAVLAVTARAPRGVYRHPELAATLDAAICCNGAIAYDFTSREADFRHPIALDTARELHRRFRQALPEALFGIETGTGQIAHSRAFQQGVQFHDPWTFIDPDADPFVGVDAVATLAVRVPGADGAALLAAARSIDPPGVRLWHWGSHPEIEYSAAAATKGDALAAWCAERDIGPESVIAFGDMPTDAPMLAWAGRSYAVANAHPEAFAAADGSTASCGDDGVAQVLEPLLGLSGPR